MTKVQITGKMWNDIVALQDRLVLLHNGLEAKPYALSWTFYPCFGCLDATIFSLNSEGRVEMRLDGFSCYADKEIAGNTVSDAIDKIIEWEKKYEFEKD